MAGAFASVPEDVASAECEASEAGNIRTVILNSYDILPRRPPNVSRTNLEDLKHMKRINALHLEPHTGWKHR